MFLFVVAFDAIGHQDWFNFARKVDRRLPCDTDDEPGNDKQKALHEQSGIGWDAVSEKGSLLTYPKQSAASTLALRKKFDQLISPGKRLILSDREFVCDPPLFYFTQ